MYYTDQKYILWHQHKKLQNVYYLQAVWFEVLTVVSMKIQVFWIVVTCWLLNWELFIINVVQQPRRYKSSSYRLSVENNPCTVYKSDLWHNHLMLAYMLSHHGFNVRWKSIAYLGFGQKCEVTIWHQGQVNVSIYILCISEFVTFPYCLQWKVVTIKQYSLVRRSALPSLHNSLQDTLLYSCH
jgi:hypothetical protein